MFKYYTIAYDSSAEYGFMYLLKEYSSGLLISAYLSYCHNDPQCCSLIPFHTQLTMLILLHSNDLYHKCISIFMHIDIYIGK